MKKARSIALSLACLSLVLSCGKEDIETPGNKPSDVPPTPQTEKTIDYTKYSLGELAAMQGIKLGAAFTYQEYMQNPKVAEILKKEFKAVTFGNEMKHDAIVQRTGLMRYDNADRMALWAQNAGAELFGHVLGWHSQQQTAYLNTVIDQASASGQSVSEAIDEAFKTFVYGMVKHFDVYAWDVVNETFADGANGAFRTKGNSARDFVWGNYYPSTKDWVDKAFAYATDACAQSGKTPVLYINDYNLETDPGKRKGLCDYVRNNPQVTGVASQMHLDISTPNLESKIEASLKDLTATGKIVRISELDLKNTSEAAQAELFKFIFQKYIEIVPQPQRGGITFWGINDKDSWLGENNHPLLWKGSQYEIKEAYKTLYLYLCEINGLSPYKE
ncbi:MAG: endo-1,4-beta-xylanase [Bacteroidales bacterium]|nr:endo-1,4-beta-xylanase [Bacteroidales bacterium]